MTDPVSNTTLLSIDQVRSRYSLAETSSEISHRSLSKKRSFSTSRLIVLTAVLVNLIPSSSWAGGAVAAVKQRQLMQQAAYQQAVQEEMARRQQQEMIRQYMAAYQQAAVQQYVEAQKQAVMVQAARQQMVQQYMAQQMAQEMAAYQQAVVLRQQALAQQQTLRIRVAQTSQYQQALMAQQIHQYMQQNAVAQAVAASQQQRLEEYRQSLVEKAIADKLATDQVQSYAAAQQVQQAQQVMAYQAATALQQMNQNKPYENVPDSFVKDVVGIGQLWKSLDASAKAWALIIDKKAKGITIKHYMDELAKEGGTISKDPLYYSQMIDDMARQNPQMLVQPLKDILRLAAIIDYDYDNGSDKDAMARRIFPDQKAFEANKRRLQQ